MDSVTDKVLDEMEAYCIARHQKQCFINRNNFISYDTLKRLKLIAEKTSPTLVGECFEILDKKEKNRYYQVETECSDCGKLFVAGITKTEIIDLYIREGRKSPCPCCEKIRRHNATIEIEEREKEEERIKTKRTALFIQQYLDPNKSLEYEISPYNGYRNICDDLYYTNKDVIAEHIKSMSYYDFLKTPYWKGIAIKKRYDASFKCELCSSKSELAVHHKTYEHHGYEYQYKDDLIVLCNNCHQKFHDKIKD